MRILLVEPNADVAATFESWFKTEGFNVITTDLGEDAVDLGKLYDYDCIVLEMNLVDMSGYEVIRSLRMAKMHTPIIVCSGLAGVEDKVRALGFGADDYVTKPVHKDELVARIVSVVRRSCGFASPQITAGPLTIDLGRKTVSIDGAQVHLTGKEYQMIELLGLRKGATVTKDSMLNHMYGGMDEPELKIIDVYICKLRKKLAVAAPGFTFIETVWGRGYTLAENPTSTPAEAVAA